MPFNTYTEPFPGNPGKLKLSYLNLWDNSNRNSKGQLVLTDHLHEFHYAAVVSKYSTLGAYNGCQGAETVSHYNFTTSDTNQLYAKLMGKLHRGDASLGVTLASMNQSMAMIRSRYFDVNELMRHALGRRRSILRRPRNGASARTLANDVLEVEFGWQPFFQDIFNSLTTITSTVPELIRVRAQIRPNPYANFVDNGEPRITTSYSGKALATAAATYRVNNPNIFLQNSLGILNPVAVAWDLIPWSFVVNMFVNANQLIGSLSDVYGLDTPTGSVTYSSALFREQNLTYQFDPNIGVRTGTGTIIRWRSRQGLSGLRPQLEFRLPKFNLELGLIASALAVQRSTRLGRLLG